MDTVDYNLYPDEKYQNNWIRFYLSVFYGKEEKEIEDSEVEKFRILSNKFALASHFNWGLWAILQEHWSSIDFDFLG